MNSLLLHFYFRGFFGTVPVVFSLFILVWNVSGNVLFVGQSGPEWFIFWPLRT